MEIIETDIYYDANRRANTPVLEQLVALEQRELTAVGELAHDVLAVRLAGAGFSVTDFEFPEIASPEDPRWMFYRFYVGTALSLQRSTGHRVALGRCLMEVDPLRCRVMFEYEDQEVAEQAGELALCLLQEVCPELILHDREAESPQTLDSLLSAFSVFSASRVLPLDTQAIIEAARQSDIPCVKLDRSPFHCEASDFRIRRNSPLRLGHGCHQHTIDSTFCIDRCEHLLPMLSDREQGMEYLRAAGLPVPAVDFESRNCNTLSRARRSAARIGLPVVVKPIRRTRGSGVTTAVEDDSQLAQAQKLARQFGSRIWMEKHITGHTYKVLVVNLRCLAVLAVSDGPQRSEDVSEGCHYSLTGQAEYLARQLGVGMLVLTCVTPDIAVPLETVGGAFVDMDLAPELDAFLAPDSILMARAATEFVHWLFPDGARSRIPLVAVTGTNGKTTTTRMTHAILSQSGYTPGLACTDGLYIKSDTRFRKGDLAGVLGHLELLGNTAIDCAVLETARGAVTKWGFGFDHCNVAVCLNVSADHLQDQGIDTVEQMAELKRTILDRASEAVVLNADNRYCLGMLPFEPEKRVCMVSTEQTVQALRQSHQNCDCFAVIEDEDGSEYITLYDGARKIPICPVSQVPATFGGRVRFNTSNIMHACAASYLLGSAPEALRAGAVSFEMNFKNTPGRMNLYDQLPFKFILDFAHNPDGIARFCEFIKDVEVPGRKIVGFSAAGYNPVDLIRGNARSLAGYFDYYYCFNFPRNIEKHYDHVPGCLRDTLLDCGIPDDRVRVRQTGMEVIDDIFGFAREGDLVAFLSGYSDRELIWERVTGGSDS